MQKYFRNTLKWKDFGKKATPDTLLDTVNSLIEHVNDHNRKTDKLNSQLQVDLPSLIKGTATTAISTSSVGSSSIVSSDNVRGGNISLVATGSPIFVNFYDKSGAVSAFTNTCILVIGILSFTNPADGSPGGGFTIINNFSNTGFYVDDLQLGVTNAKIMYMAFGS
jgi:hypothetical protein